MNPQSPASEADALSIRPQKHHNTVILINPMNSTKHSLIRQNISNPIIKLLKINNDYIEQSTVFEYSSIPIIEKIQIT